MQNILSSMAFDIMKSKENFPYQEFHECANDTAIFLYMATFGIESFNKSLVDWKNSYEWIQKNINTKFQKFEFIALVEIYFSHLVERPDQKRLLDIVTSILNGI